MKKLFTFILSVAIALLSLAIVGCGKSSDPDALKICFYNGGYGEEWLENACKAYAEKNSDFKYKLFPSSDQDCSFANKMQSNDVPDIFMCLGDNISDYITKGDIVSLEEVYNGSVEKLDGSVVSVYDYMLPSVRDMYFRQQKAGQGQVLPWAVPWTVLPGAMAYNEDLLKTIEHKDSSVISADRVDPSTNKWIAPPTTVSELISYCNDINAYNEANGYTVANGKYIAPIGWSASQPAWLFFCLYSWWAEYQGVSVSNVEGEGSFYDFFNYGNGEFSYPDQTISMKGYEQTGLQVAIDTLRSLVVDETNQTYKNSPYSTADKKKVEIGLQRLEQNFVQGRYAMTLASSFLEYETKNITNKVNFLFTSVPVLDEFEGDKIPCFSASNEIMFIPKKAAHQDLAKQFLLFLCQESQVMEFTKTTGSIRPFVYNPVELAQDYAWTDFNRSVFEVYAESEILTAYPCNVKERENVSCVYRFSKKDIFGDMNIINMASNLLSWNGKQIMIDGKDGQKGVIELTRNSFNSCAELYRMKWAEGEV